MLNLGNLFGSEEELMAVATVPEKKAPAAKKEKSKGKTPPVKTFKLPLKLIWCDKTLDVTGEGTLTEDELLVKASDLAGAPRKVLCVKATDKDGIVGVYPANIADPEPKDIEGWTVCYNGFSMPATKDVKETKRLFAEQYQAFNDCTFLYDSLTKTIFPVAKPMSLTEKVVFPCSYSWFGGETVDGFFPDSLKAAGKKETPKKEEDEEEVVGFELDDEEASDTEEEPAPTKAEADAALTRTYRTSELTSAFNKLFNYKVTVAKDGDAYVLFPERAGGLASAAPAVKEEKKYPTEGTELSLMLRHIPLSPEMFAGKKEVTSEQLLNWLTPQYPEYSKDRTCFEYDEKAKLIIAILKGASKG